MAGEEREPALDRLKRLPTDLRLILEKRASLFLIETGERLSAVSGRFAVAMVLGAFAGLGILFLLFALAFWMSDVLNSHAAGFFFVGGLMLILGFLAALIVPPHVERWVRASVVKALVDPDPARITPPESESHPASPTDG